MASLKARTAEEAQESDVDEIRKRFREEALAAVAKAVADTRREAEAEHNAQVQQLRRDWEAERQAQVQELTAQVRRLQVQAASSGAAGLPRPSESREATVRLAKQFLSHSFVEMHDLLGEQEAGEAPLSIPRAEAVAAVRSVLLNRVDDLVSLLHANAPQDGTSIGTQTPGSWAIPSFSGGDASSSGAPGGVPAPPGGAQAGELGRPAMATYPPLPLHSWPIVADSEIKASGLFSSFISYTVQTLVLPPSSLLAPPDTRTTHRILPPRCLLPVDGSLEGSVVLGVSRRYTEFRQLWSTLSRSHPRVILPELPPKRSVQAHLHFTNEFVEQRRKELALWLRHVVSHPALLRARPLAFFCCGPNIPPFWKDLVQSSTGASEESCVPEGVADSREPTVGEGQQAHDADENEDEEDRASQGSTGQMHLAETVLLTKNQLALGSDRVFGENALEGTSLEITRIQPLLDRALEHSQRFSAGLKAQAVAMSELGAEMKDHEAEEEFTQSVKEGMRMIASLVQDRVEEAAVDKDADPGQAQTGGSGRTSPELPGQWSPAGGADGDKSRNSSQGGGKEESKSPSSPEDDVRSVEHALKGWDAEWEERYLHILGKAEETTAQATMAMASAVQNCAVLPLSFYAKTCQQESRKAVGHARRLKSTDRNVAGKTVAVEWRQLSEIRRATVAMQLLELSKDMETHWGSVRSEWEDALEAIDSLPSMEGMAISFSDELQALERCMSLQSSSPRAAHGPSGSCQGGAASSADASAGSSSAQAPSRPSSLRGAMPSRSRPIISRSLRRLPVRFVHRLHTFFWAQKIASHSKRITAAAAEKQDSSTSTATVSGTSAAVEPPDAEETSAYTTDAYRARMEAYERAVEAEEEDEKRQVEDQVRQAAAMLQNPNEARRALQRRRARETGGDSALSKPSRLRRKPRQSSPSPGSRTSTSVSGATRTRKATLFHEQPSNRPSVVGSPPSTTPSASTPAAAPAAPAAAANGHPTSSVPSPEPPATSVEDVRGTRASSCTPPSSSTTPSAPQERSRASSTFQSRGGGDYDWGTQNATAPSQFPRRQPPTASNAEPPKAAAPSASSFAPPKKRNGSDEPPPVPRADGASAAANSRASPSNCTPLPTGWEEVVQADGSKYYFHRVTRISRWVQPDAAVAREIEERIAAEEKAQRETIARRKEEMEKKKAKDAQDADAADKVKSRVEQEILAWKGNRSLPQLLSDLGRIYSQAPALTLPTQPQPSEVKKAYLKAARVIHPDKVSSVHANDIEQRVRAELLFLCVSALYETYRDANNL